MFRERTGAHQEILASWGNYIAVVDNSTTHFKKINAGLVKACTRYQWCVIENKYSGNFITKGLFSPTSADKFFRKVSWDRFNQKFLFPDDLHEVTEMPNTAERMFSTKVYKSVVDDFIRDGGALSLVHASEEKLSYNVPLSFWDKGSAGILDEKEILIDVRKIPSDSLCVWFDLRIAVSK